MTDLDRRTVLRDRADGLYARPADPKLLSLLQALFGDSLERSPSLNWQGRERSSNVVMLPPPALPMPQEADFLGKSLQSGDPTREEFEALQDAQLAWAAQGLPAANTPQELAEQRAIWEWRKQNAPVLKLSGVGGSLAGRSGVDSFAGSVAGDVPGQIPQTLDFPLTPEGDAQFSAAMDAWQKEKRNQREGVITGNAGNDTLRGGATGVPPEGLAFLDAISGPESRGLYDIRYGGGRFSDFADHPRTHKKITSGPNKGKTSSAAGRYQITETTWDNVIQPALNLPDFSPQSQDIAAWYLAQQDYKRKGGGDLLGDLRTGDPTVIGKAAKKLAGTWTSLPGGIEQTTSVNRFNTAYANALERRMVSPAVPPPPNRGNALGAIAAALGTPETTASAFSPDVGSLQANPAAEDTAPTVPAQVLRALETTRRAETVPATLAAALQPNVATTPAVETATSPAMETIRAQFADDLGTAPTGGVNRGRRQAAPPPVLDEQALTKWVEAGNFTPAPRDTGLTTRKVQTIAVGPNDPLAGNVSAPDLQSALNRVAEKRRQAQSTNGVAEQRQEQLSRGRRTVYVPSNGGAVRTATSPGALTVAANEATPVPGNGPTETIQAEFAPEPNPYGGSPVFGDNPDLERLVAQPEPPPVPTPNDLLVAAAPDSLLSGATKAPLGALTKTGTPAWFKPKGVPPEQQTNPSVYEVLAGIKDGSIPDDGLIPSKGTGAVIDALKSPGAQMLGEMNAGKRPLMSLLAGMFLPRQGFGQVATSRSMLPAGYRGASAEGGLSGAQIDRARSQSGGDGDYEALIRWAMSS